MKIIKKKEVVIEEVEVQIGTYYFECHEGIFHKIMLEQESDDSIEYIMESVENYNSPYGIIVREDYALEGDDFPYKFSAFLLWISGKKIKKQEFEQQKQEVINRLQTL